MGMYTELVFGARLRSDIPKKVEKVLKYLVSERMNVPEELLGIEHPFFQSERWQWIFKGGSYYFGIHRPHSIFEWDDISKSYSLSTRSSIKNYDNEIEKFLDWIKPYIRSGSGTRDMYAVVTYEEEPTPTLYYLHEEEE